MVTSPHTVKKPAFSPSQTFEYGGSEKKRFLYGVIGILVLVIAIALLYIFSLQHIDFFLINWINSFINHITSTIQDVTLLGIIYTAFFGGLFFVFVPLEALLVRFFITGNNPVFIIILYLVGLTLSFSLNYYVGSRLSSLCKRLIATKKFYWIKSKLNRYGGLTIFIFNLFPLPAPPLSAIVGVFNYNKKRFYLSFISAQFLKVLIIALLFPLF